MSVSDKAIIFSFDEQTAQTLSEIRKTLRASSNGEVLRRAIDLLGVASKVVEGNGKIIIKDDQGREKEIILC